MSKYKGIACRFILSIFILSLSMITIAGCGGGGGGSSDSDDSGGGSTVEQCATPVFSPSAGTFDSDQTVTISTTTEGAKIYYTIDNSAPSTSSEEYSAPISVAGNGTSRTIKAIAIKSGMDDSDIASGTFSISYNLAAVNEWTWVSGNNTTNQTGVYGTKGVAASTNKPGAREGSATWIDNSGNFWLFGGLGVDSNGDTGGLNDLWRFDGTNWTWVSGNNRIDQSVAYGTKGVAASTNNPGAREGCITWIDETGNLWLFGGDEYYSSGDEEFLNDLWKFDGTNWIWISGNNTTNQTGVYGTKGVAASTNKPGARTAHISWIDSTGDFWLFGGHGYDSNGHLGVLNDLWKFDGTNWTWISGNSLRNQLGVYGTKGVVASTNNPGARKYSISYKDSAENFWLFGGYGYDGNGNDGALNDLWKFDGTNWTWVSGNNTTDQSGLYGTKGIAASTNKPGAREGGSAWIDDSDNFWLFGGYGYDSNGDWEFLNDLWKFDGTNWTWVSGDNTINQLGVYGTKGVAASINKPGARALVLTWIDSTGNLWLFGGEVNATEYSDIDENIEFFNDLWKFEP